jgi:hypothetical protein
LTFRLNPCWLTYPSSSALSVAYVTSLIFSPTTKNTWNFLLLTKLHVELHSAHLGQNYDLFSRKIEPLDCFPKNNLRPSVRVDLKFGWIIIELVMKGTRICGVKSVDSCIVTCAQLHQRSSLRLLRYNLRRLYMLYRFFFGQDPSLPIRGTIRHTSKDYFGYLQSRSAQPH